MFLRFGNLSRRTRIQHTWEILMLKMLNRLKV